MAVREATKSSVKMDYCFRLLTRQSNRERICKTQGCKTFKYFTRALFVGPCLRPPIVCKNDLTTTTNASNGNNNGHCFRTFSTSSTRDARRGSLNFSTAPQLAVSSIMSHLLAGDLHVNISRYNTHFGFQPHRNVSGRVSYRKSTTHYYDVLGLSPTATQHQIKSAYYKMSKLHHPDVTECTKSHALFTEVNEAYETLGNLRKRRLYDKGLFTHGAVRNDFTAETAANADDNDYTEAYRKKSPFERGNRPPPPKGRSKIYNFDEFYRQHYGDMRERRWSEQVEYSRFKETMEQNRKAKEQQFSLPVLIGFYSAVFLIMGIILCTNVDYDVNRLPKTQTQSRD